MERKQTRRWKTLLLAVVCFALGGGVALTVAWQSLGQEGQSLLQAYGLITRKFVGEYDQRTMVESALENMVTALGDRWSGYLDPQQAQQVKDTRANTYVGIGVTIGQEPEDGLEILRVTEGGPAQGAGLTPGEIIRGVDGQTITAENRDEMVRAIQGEAGTTVTLEVESTDGARRTVEVARQEIHGVTATWTMLEGQVGLVTIQNFYSGTAELVQQGVAELQAQGAQALVFDLRNNPGGYVTELTAILDYLLPEGTIFISRTNDGEETVYTSDAACIDLPMAVLVNADSYSAAEFFAAELREAAGAVVAGEQTSGKGYSQMLFTLADGSAISLSTARYYTGSGVSLIGTGVTPDPLVELSQEDQQRLLTGTLPPEEDPQLQGALESLA